MNATRRRIPVSVHREFHGLVHHCHLWAGEGAPIVLLHGFQDCGATFQFLVDALATTRTVAAPDWRGFGLSGWAPGGYWFPDYFADLDEWLRHLSPEAPVDLVGHSMGGNVALVYAGLRTERVRRVATLEGFGLPAVTPDHAPSRYREWLDQLNEPKVPTIFPSHEVFTAILRRRNPRLTPERAHFIANAWAATLDDGRVQVRFDPAHRRVNPVLYRREEAEACWRLVRAPVLYVAGADSEYRERLHGAGDPDVMRRHVPQLEAREIAGSGHMLHHDQPDALATVLEPFLDT
jgi:pimeloyl-ACP methyl ester carboxylesterase